MPTEKPRITFTVNPETLEKIDDYRYSHKMKNQTQAILSLLETGFSALSQSSCEDSAKTEAATQTGSGHSRVSEETAAFIDTLPPDEQERVQNMIRAMYAKRKDSQ